MPSIEIVVIGPDAPARARNAALAATQADVLAFVDDDVVVPAGWRERLEAAWAAAPEHRATMGGPIAVEVTDRPRWLTDALLGAFAPLDYGDEPRVIAASERTLHGGNVSFRTAALRGAGGFWPARGHTGARDWFGEEHAAQRELAAAGWSAEYRPELGMTRRVARPTRTALLRARLRYGARLAVQGDEERAGGRLAAGAAAGALVAALRLDGALATERAARAAENLGFALGPRIAHDDFQPVEISTPFRPSVPDPQPRKPPRARRARGPHATILLYHRIASPEHDPLGLCVSPESFSVQIDAIRDRVVPLEQIAAGEFEDGAVAITFDDGYLDNLTEAAPRLGGIPATFFISTGHVENGWAFWWDTVGRLLRTSTATGPLRAGDREWPARSPAEREVARRHLNAWLQVKTPEEIEAIVEQVRAWAGIEDGDDPRPMTVDELRELARTEGVSIGAHTRRHVSLRWRTPEEQRDEIERSRDDLAAWLGSIPKAFSYPFGVPGRDFDKAASRLAAGAGFRVAVSNRPGRVSGSPDLLALPRFVARDSNDPQFADVSVR